MTFVGVSAGVGRSKLGLVGGNLAARLISQDDTGAKVALVATTALLLGGDRVDLEMQVGPGCWLEIVETAGTVAYDADGEPSSWNVRVTVGHGGLLLWHGEPFVVANGADTARRNHFELGDGASMCLRETVVLGRTGEAGGALRIQNRVDRCTEPLLIEELDLRELQTRRLPGVLGPAKVIDTVTLIGAAVPDQPVLPSGVRFDLDGSAGAIGRVLRSGLAGSPASRWWSSWSRAARTAHHTAPH